MRRKVFNFYYFTFWIRVTFPITANFFRTFSISLFFLWWNVDQRNVWLGQMIVNKELLISWLLYIAVFSQLIKAWQELMKCLMLHVTPCEITFYFNNIRCNKTKDFQWYCQWNVTAYLKVASLKSRQASEQMYKNIQDKKERFEWHTSAFK